MRELVANLLELQELEIIREESRIVHEGRFPEELAELEARIRRLRAAVPAESLKRYDGHRRNGLGAVREDDGTCTGCRLHVPMGDLQRMRHGLVPWICPNCGRFLLLAPA